MGFLPGGWTDVSSRAPSFRRNRAPASPLAAHVPGSSADRRASWAPQTPRNEPSGSASRAPMCGVEARAPSAPARRPGGRRDRAAGPRRRSSPRTSRRPRPAPRSPAARRARASAAPRRAPRAARRACRRCRRRGSARAPAGTPARCRGPAVRRMIATPVSASPAIIARSIGAAPRQRGSSDGWTLSSSCSDEQRLLDAARRTRRRPPRPARPRRSERGPRPR